MATANELRNALAGIVNFIAEIPAEDPATWIRKSDEWRAAKAAMEAPAEHPKPLNLPLDKEASELLERVLEHEAEQATPEPQAADGGQFDKPPSDELTADYLRQWYAHFWEEAAFVRDALAACELTKDIPCTTGHGERRLVPALIEKIKELAVERDRLAAEVEELKRENASLRNEVADANTELLSAKQRMRSLVSKHVERRNADPAATLLELIKFVDASLATPPRPAADSDWENELDIQFNFTPSLARRLKAFIRERVATSPQPAVADTEKQTRIEYQNMVYEICRIVDAATGRTLGRNNTTVGDVAAVLAELLSAKGVDAESRQGAAAEPYCEAPRGRDSIRFYGPNRRKLMDEYYARIVNHDAEVLRQNKDRGEQPAVPAPAAPAETPLNPIGIIRQKLEAIVCTEGCDRGVILLSSDGPTHTELVNGKKVQVYDHENFSPLGDALIELHDLTSGDSLGSSDSVHRSYQDAGIFKEIEVRIRELAALHRRRKSSNPHPDGPLPELLEFVLKADYQHVLRHLQRLVKACGIPVTEGGHNPDNAFDIVASIQATVSQLQAEAQQREKDARAMEAVRKYKMDVFERALSGSFVAMTDKRQTAEEYADPADAALALASQLESSGGAE